MSANEIVEICLQLIEILNRLGIPYALGGSMASSLQGAPRSTKDADLVVDIQSPQTSAFLQAVEPYFLINKEIIAKAVQEKRSFNLIHLESMLKVDIFPVLDEPFWRTEFSRREEVTFLVEGTVVWCTSPEDIILKKLYWYRKGGENSDRQWQDILEVFRVHTVRLDTPYMDKWSVELQVSDLLAKAIQQSQL